MPDHVPSPLARSRDEAAFATRGEAGLSLVELVVATFVLGIVLAGLASVSISSLRVTQINRDRAVASNLAQAELERLRTLSFVDLQGMLGANEPVTRTAGELAYQVRTEVSWSSLDADTDPCSEPEGSTEQAVLRADVAVWPGTAEEPGDAPVSRSSTQIARPPTTPTPGTGALGVRVSDHQDPPQGTALVLVSVTGPSPAAITRSQTTPATGCVLFVDLPAGEYDVKVRRAQHVGIRPGPDEAEPVRPAGVRVDSRTVVDISYAPAATASLGATPLTGGTPLLPTAVPVTLGRDGRVTAGPVGSELTPLWPGRWETWLGDCPAADPGGLHPAEEGDPDFGLPRWPGAERQDPVVLPPSRTTVLAGYPTVRFNLTPPAGSGGTPAPVTLRAISEEPCVEGTAELTFPGTLVPGGQPVDLGLPFGTWRLVATGADGTATATVEVDPTRNGPFTPTTARWSR